MESKWSKEETAWLRKARRLFTSQPQSIVLCTSDGDIAACKRGVPSRDLQEDLSPGYVKSGDYISDVHDDADCNR